MIDMLPDDDEDDGPDWLAWLHVTLVASGVIAGIILLVLYRL